jgi:radical SAM protein (TIGR01212 family)
MLYNNLSSFFRKKYGTRLKKICIDGGFSCPNRDGKVGTGGCIYCGERGAGEHISNTCSIRIQVENGLKNANANDKFIAYFQNFSNTYADIDTLKKRYDEALCDKRIVALAIGTRPDCIDGSTAKLISEYKDRVDVWVELGLQTSNDRTAEIINRGYTRDVFEGAVNILNSYGIDTVAHMIIGLPGETPKMIFETAGYIGKSGADGIKLQLLHVLSGTDLAKDFEAGKFEVLELDKYIEILEECIRRLPPEMTVHRLTGDGSKKHLIAPLWSADKKRVLNAINSAFEKDKLIQGEHL